MSAYTEAQAALAASEGGRKAEQMVCGSRWRTPAGDTVTVWKEWKPDTAGDAEAAAARYKWPLASNHNSQIGVASRGKGVCIVDVISVVDWIEI